MSLSHLSLVRVSSVQIRVTRNKTVLPTATQTRALERHDGDMISSVGIPLAMAAGAIGLLAMGLKDLATGSNKKDGF